MVQGFWFQVWARRSLRTAAICSIALAGCKSSGQRSANDILSVTAYQVKVEKGDTLASIAKQFDTSWQNIVSINRDQLKGGLRIGQILKVQPGPSGIVAIKDDRGAMSHEENFDDPFETDGLPRSDRNQKGLLFAQPKSKSAVKRLAFIFPAEGSISSAFGIRHGRLHKGIDIRASLNSPIRAAADGEVTFSGRKRGYGNTIIVDHGKYATLYAHCNKLIARVGDVVRQGDFIAKVGKTGNARGIHLHFEIRDIDNRPVDPETLLPNNLISMVSFANFNRPF